MRNIYRPDKPIQRRFLLGGALLVMAIGVWNFVAGISGDATLLIVGIILVVGAGANLVNISRNWPRGFQFPDEVNPDDQVAVKAAVARFRRERRRQQ